MYPFTLNLTRDECRGMLRRLELESYSNVISTFRAQGGLSDIKIKLLEDLRNAFHISQDRHRAEARRVAKDEQLSTIAEMIYGPNTHQEWQKEGRRAFPLFPRAIPLTALAAVANGVAKTASEENSKLPYPSETAELSKRDELPFSKDKSIIVQKDPILAAEEERKNLKRSLSFAEHLALSFPSRRKRTISGESIPLSSQSHVHTNAKIQQLYNNHIKTQSRHRKNSSKKNAHNTSKKANQGKPSQPKIIKTLELPVSEGKSHVPNPRSLHSYANVPTQKAIPGGSNIDLDPYRVNKLPQIATSKKDITNNLSKLNLSQMSQQMHLQNSYIPENEHKIDKSEINAQKITVDDSNQVMGTHYSGSNILFPAKGNVLQMSSGRCNVKPLVIGTKYQIKPKPPEYHNTQSSPLVTVIDPSNHDIGRLNTSHAPNTIAVIGRPENDAMSKKVTTATEQICSTVNLSSGGELQKLTTVPVIVSSGEIQTHTVNKAQIQAVVTKPKIQITSQQILTPALSNIKLPIGVQIKGVPGNRKNVKILSSGKMILQTLDNSKSITRLGSVVTSKNLTGASVISPVSPGRQVTVQKLQLVQSPNNKSISISKPNMILMPATVGSTSGGGNTFFKSIPISKNTKLQIVGDKQTPESNFGGITKTQNNVFVIGAIPSEKLSAKDDEISSSNSGMITEDTPVDILPPPMSNVDPIGDSSINNISREAEPYEMKPSMVRTISLNSNAGVRKTTTGSDLKVVLNSSETAGMVELRLLDNNLKNSEKRQNFVVDTTDWELELDFEAKKLRNSMEKRNEINRISADNIDNDNGDMIGINDDNFHDVIEEETVEDDEEIISDNAGTMDGTLEYHITCGSGSEEIDENVTIEYVEDSRSNLFEEEEDEIICKEKFGNAYEAIECDGFVSRNTRKDDLKQALNNNIRRMQNGTFNRKNLESSAVIYEMQGTDQKGLIQAKNTNRLSSEYMQV